MPDFSKLKLPFWMNKGELAKLLAACKKFWQWLYDWLLWPSKQFDPLVCPEPLLALLAWERDITRFNGEPLDLFRKRVAYAWINARDAGSVEGFIAYSTGWASVMWSCRNGKRERTGMSSLSG